MIYSFDTNNIKDNKNLYGKIRIILKNHLNHLKMIVKKK